MNANYSHITLILDRSGSMSSIRDDVVGGVNAFIEEQRKVAGKCTFSLIQFDDIAPYDPIYDFVELGNVKPLGAEYKPRGNTPLHDAVGKGIVALGAKLGQMPESERPGKVIFVTMTDGQENASKEYDAAKVSAMAKEQTEKYNWQFVYLGANQNAVAVGASIGTTAQNSANYTPKNTCRALGITGQSVASYRSSGNSEAMSYSTEQREELVK